MTKDNIYALITAGGINTKTLYIILAALFAVMCVCGDGMATSFITIWHYQPNDETGLPAVTLLNYGGEPVTIKDCQVQLQYAGSRSTVTIEQPVYINGEEYGAGWEFVAILLRDEDKNKELERNKQVLSIQLLKAGEDFMDQRYNLTRVTIYGKIYTGKDPADTYRPVEIIDDWTPDPEVMKNVTGHQRIMRGELLYKPGPDYIN